MAFNFIGGWNRSTWRKPPTLPQVTHKLHHVMLYRNTHWRALLIHQRKNKTTPNQSAIHVEIPSFQIQGLQMHFKVSGHTQKYNFNNLCYLPIPQNTDRRIITVQNPTCLLAGISMICFHPNFSLINSILELYMIIFRHNSQMEIHFVFQKWRIL